MALLGGTNPNLRRLLAKTLQSTLTKEAAMTDQSAYAQKLNAKLDEWQANIDKMKAQAERAQADGKIEYEEQIQELRVKRDEMERKLEELQEANESAWEDVKKGADRAWDNMSKAMQEAWDRFSSSPR